MPGSTSQSTEPVTDTDSGLIAEKPLAITYNGVEYPSGADLRFWYLCYRKLAYDSEQDALDVARAFNNVTNVYLCRYGDHYHNGRPTKGHKSENELRREWKRKDRKPSLEELRNARVTGKVKESWDD